MLSEEERAVLRRVPRKGKGYLKSSDISDKFPKARYVLRRLYDNGYVDRKLVSNAYGYFLTDKGEKEIGE
jgi:Mn-dependent DtxR family transcriptional regulator